MENEIIVLNPIPEYEGERLDKYLCTQLDGYSRSSIQKLCDDGLVSLNEKILSKNYKIRKNEEIVVELPPPQILDLIAQDIPIEIVYEDDCLLVVNKPKGMVVHPAPGNYDNTLVNALLYHCRDRLSSINGVIRPGIVHRIDKDTSGLLIVAKNDEAHISLSAQIKEHSFDRFYHAVVYGRLKNENGTINAPIGRNPSDRKKMCITDRNSREAVTHYESIGYYDGYTHVKLKLETGRTHQIRVHMEHLGFPVVGDPIYGRKKAIASLSGQCLHAQSIGFVHPKTGEQMYFETDLPEYFTSFLSKLKPL